MPHFEKYKVISKSVSNGTMTLGVTPMSVPDSPVDDVCFRDFLPGGCTSLTGVENPVDDIAWIYANHPDWTDAVNTIQANTHFVRYLSSAGSPPSVEYISTVSWGRI